jgi:2-keto-3-deoxy-L-fuconate dehydrogenase
MRLQNKTCIVTGAGAGIGFATARAFADEGATVIALDRDQAGLSTLARRQSSLNTQILDVTDVDAVVEFFKVQDKADVLFNCAVWSPRETS